MKNFLYKIIGYILNILLIIITLLILVGIYYIIQIKILKNDFANLCGYTFFEVATGSMENTINIGDVVIVNLTKDVNENDIIVYKDDSNFITHRLIKKQADKLITRGDANNSEDKPINEDQILGKVIYIVPKMGIFRKIFISKEILGLVIAILILLGILFVYEAKKA